MNSTVIRRSASYLMLVALAGLPVSGQDAATILKKLDEATFAPKDQVATVSIRLIEKNGTESVRKAEMKGKGTNMRITRFTEPASQKGIAFLSLPNDVMYIYLPAFGNERRIASHVRNQSFAGTDFTYEDMEAVAYSDKFDPKLLENKPEHYVLELTPKQGTNSDYSKLIITIRKDNHCAEKVEFYNRGGLNCKVLRNKAEMINGYWTNTTMEMHNLQKGHKTIMSMDKISFDNNLSDDEFTVRKMKQ